MGEMVTKAKTGCDSSSKRQYYLGFFFRMVVFVILLTIIIFIFGTVFTRKFWLPDLLENFVYVSCCTFFCALILRGLYDRISPFSRLLFFMIFTVLAVIGVGLGLVAGSFILEGKWSGNVDFLFALGIGVFASIGVTFYEVQKSKLEENIIRLKDVEVENEQLKRIESEARFNTLQAKLNPEFDRRG